jgi:hypothetical protein
MDPGIRGRKAIINGGSVGGGGRSFQGRRLRAQSCGLPGTDTGPPSVERCYCAFFAAASQIQTN